MTNRDGMAETGTAVQKAETTATVIVIVTRTLEVHSATETQAADFPECIPTAGGIDRMITSAGAV